MRFLQNVIQLYLSGETRFTTLLVMTKYSPRTVIPKISSAGTTAHMYLKLSFP